MILEDAEQLVKVLNKENNHVILKSANRLYSNRDKSILEDYIQAAVKYFAADVKSVDFTSNPEGSRQEINKWVEEVTNEKIKNMLPSGTIDTLTRMVVANAIYFKENCSRPFETRRTKKANFHTLGGQSVKVAMMQRTMHYPRFGENKDFNCRVLQLPYIGDEMAMVVLLPKTVDGLLEMEKSIDLVTLNQCIKNETFAPNFEVFIPKFKIESSLQLSGTLSALGMPDVFDESKADLSGMGKEDLFVSEVFHKAFVNVNEEGTEAAAGSGLLVLCMEYFKADHPFMFMIWRYQLNAPLFVGRFTGPTSETA
ncbi:leukocyte elastase inhibitor-like [Dreissena polymorpha]|uniref:leukocyte elastase inhibitor-like n=1 Tax=Dreissena polymorpha TaxID=45954 RepID=UPI00226452F8|nr:leukocyte elastase inhibitor-like [Dreissena polymorpha]